MASGDLPAGIIKRSEPLGDFQSYQASSIEKRGVAAMLFSWSGLDISAEELSRVDIRVSGTVYHRVLDWNHWKLAAMDGRIGENAIEYLVSDDVSLVTEDYLIEHPRVQVDASRAADLAAKIARHVSAIVPTELGGAAQVSVTKVDVSRFTLFAPNSAIVVDQKEIKSAELPDVDRTAFAARLEAIVRQPVDRAKLEIAQQIVAGARGAAIYLHPQRGILIGWAPIHHYLDPKHPLVERGRYGIRITGGSLGVVFFSGVRGYDFIIPSSGTSVHGPYALKPGVTYHITVTGHWDEPSKNDLNATGYETDFTIPN